MRQFACALTVLFCAWSPSPSLFAQSIEPIKVNETFSCRALPTWRGELRDAYTDEVSDTYRILGQSDANLVEANQTFRQARRKFRRAKIGNLPVKLVRKRRQNKRLAKAELVAARAYREGIDACLSGELFAAAHAKLDRETQSDSGACRAFLNLGADSTSTSRLIHTSPCTYSGSLVTLYSEINDFVRGICDAVKVESSKRGSYYVTAASCIKRFSGDAQFTRIYSNNAEPQVVTEIFVHPGFDPTNPFLAYDVAILKTEAPSWTLPSLRVFSSQSLQAGATVYTGGANLLGIHEGNREEALQLLEQQVQSVGAEAGSNTIDNFMNDLIVTAYSSDNGSFGAGACHSNLGAPTVAFDQDGPHLIGVGTVSENCHTGETAYDGAIDLTAAENSKWMKEILLVKRRR